MSTVVSTPSKKHTNKPLVKQKQGLFWEARTRILVWYITLMTGFIGLCVPIFTKLVFSQVNARVTEDIAIEMDTFEKAIEQVAFKSPPITPTQLTNLLTNFLYQELPEDDTFLITILNGRFYRSSSRALPLPLQENSPLMQHWITLTQEEKNEKLTSDPKIGSILYHAKPIIINKQLRGVFVVVHTTAGERREAIETIIIVIQVLLVGLLFAILLAWVVSGKVLTPLRSLIKASRSIGEGLTPPLHGGACTPRESDLTKRLPLQGSGEIAELAITFNEMMDRLQQTFNTQRDYFNEAGHELRTLITIIRSHLELLGDDPQEKQKTIKIVLDELMRMSRFVDDLIVLAKSEQPDFLQLETVDINYFTEELYTKAIGLASRNWIIENRGQGRMIADRQRITQAMMNLAQNAVQHTKEKHKICIGSLVTNDYVRFWVKDTGKGIARTEQQRIFQRFAQPCNNNCRRSTDEGLGLSIVKAIAQAHEGWIEVMSDLGVGSIFTLVIPLHPPQNR